MIFINNQFHKQVLTTDILSYNELKIKVSKKLNIAEDEFYFLNNGRLLSDNVHLENGMTIQFILRLNGGKGGFGSMLRAIGAQIEKTTNREACRDLSGRRLRDINEEKRLKNWIASQSDREREANERKQKKLERLCVVPKHKFEDSEYEKLRSELPEKVSNAVEQGFKVATDSTNNLKRKNPDNKKKKSKKSKLWVDADLSCSDESDSDVDESTSRKETESELSGQVEEEPLPSTSRQETLQTIKT